jgi:hypothetical protein
MTGITFMANSLTSNPSVTALPYKNRSDHVRFVSGLPTGRPMEI